MFIQWKSLTRLLSVRTSWLTRIESNLHRGTFFTSLLSMDLIALLSRFALFSLRLKLIFQVRLGFLALYFDLRWVLLFLLRKKRLRIKFYHYAAHSYIHHVHSFFFFSCRYHHGNATDNQVNMENTRWKEMKSSRDLLLLDFVITCCQVFRYNHRCIWFWLFVFTSLLGSREPSSSQ